MAKTQPIPSRTIPVVKLKLCTTIFCGYRLLVALKGTNPGQYFRLHPSTAQPYSKNMFTFFLFEIVNFPEINAN